MLIVRGGWDGHHPVESTDAFIPFLLANDFDVTVEQSTGVYADAEIMGEVDLILQCVTMSEIGRGGVDRIARRGGARDGPRRVARWDR